MLDWQASKLRERLGMPASHPPFKRDVQGVLAVAAVELVFVMCRMQVSLYN